MLSTVALLSCFLIGESFCRVYDRCELARELKDVHKVEEKDIATWVCIARHESELNTSAVGHLNWDGSGDHGLFQISDLYWCSPPGNGYSCGLTCAQLEDEDIKDDVACAKRIHRQHQRLSGNGFTAWAVYRAHCAGDVEKYIEGCYENVTTHAELDVANELTKVDLPSEDKIKSELPKSEELSQKKYKTEEKVAAPGSEFAKSKSDEKSERTAFKSSAVHAEVTKRSRITPNEDVLVKAKPKPTKSFYAKLYEFVYEP